MDAIEKFLRSLSSKEQRAMLLLVQQLKHDYRNIPGLASLHGKRGWFRVRLGRYRIIFTVDRKTRHVEIRRITKRDEHTYKNLP